MRGKAQRIAINQKIAQSNLGTGRVATNSSANLTHHPKPQLQRFTHCRTATPQTPHWLQWGAPYSPPKIPTPVNQSQNPSIYLIPGPIRPTFQNLSHIQSAVCHNALDRQTDRQTNRWLEKMLDDYRPLLLHIESAAA